MVNEGRQNGDIRAILALSQAEALAGARRTVKLPGGQRIVVPIPAGAQDGQQIRLEGQGRLSPYGGRGTLILTISLATAEHALARTRSNANADKPTGSSRTPYLSQRQSPINVDSTFPAYTPQPRDAIPPPYNAPSPQKYRRPSNAITLLLIACVFLVVGFSAITLYTTVIQPRQFHSQADATAAAKTMGTAQANVRSTARTDATAQIRNNATATAQARAFVHATATAASQQKVYIQATSANPALKDPLQQQDNNRWEENSKSVGGGCAFTSGAYHVSVLQTGFFASCYNQSNIFSNFVFQVQMTILKGASGGIIFRSTNSNTNFYQFRVGQDGSYDLFLYVDTYGSNAKPLAQGSSSAIQRGLNRSNKIAVIALGNSLSLYINQQYVTSVTDTTYQSGAIGVFADDQLKPTEVAFNNAEVWIL